MKESCVAIFLIISVIASDLILIAGKLQYRRILHQPMFPASSAPPQSPPSQDRPFFQGQGKQSPPPVAGSGELVRSPAANEKLSEVKKVAIAVSSGILTLAMVSALGLYLYKHCADQPGESQKLGAGNSGGRDSGMPAASRFLYIGTVEPSSRSLVEDSAGANFSPYRKLNSGRKSDRYRPSPDLQPLPPLPRRSAPPLPISSSDDDSHDTDFYTPQGSSISNESPISPHGGLSQSVPENRVGGGVPLSKGSSPKSRLSASSPDKTPVMIPSIKRSPPPPPPPPKTMLRPLQTSKTRSYAPVRTNSEAPPESARLRLINGEERQNPKLPIAPPPPPPPPPPQLSIPGKIRAAETQKLPRISKQAMKLHSFPLTLKSNSDFQKTNPIDDEDKILNSSEAANDRDEKDRSKPKLKPLHWDKVRATSDQATVWDQLNSNSFPLNEDAMESLFGCKEASRKPALHQVGQEYRVLDPKKSQNIAIILRASNITIEKVSETLLNGNSEGLGAELLETLVKMAPTKEEEIKLKQYKGETSRLGSAERFLKAMLDVPYAFKRIEAMLYRANFAAEVVYLRKSFQTLEEASEELKNSRLFLKLLEAVLRTGNRMNDGTNRGDARAFKLDTLLKLADVKGTDGKTTLLHFVVQEIIRSEGAAMLDPSKVKDDEFKKQGLQVVSGLSHELGNVKRAAGMDSDVLSSYVAKLETGLDKVRSVVQYEKQGKFFDSMKDFVDEATEQIATIKDEERKGLSVVKEVTEYFHGDAAKEEAHPFRIFMIVRDFLTILDNVCRDVRRMQGPATIGTGRSFRATALEVTNR